MHGIYRTFMVLHILNLCELTFFHDGRMNVKFGMRGYFFVLNDFPVQTSMSQR